MNAIIVTIVIIIFIYLVIQYLFTLYFYKKGKKLSEIVYTGTFTLGNRTKLLTFTIIGDSVGAGIGASSETKTIPYRVGEKLSKNYKVKVKNESKVGTKIENILTVDVEKPDILLISIGSNDLFHFTNIKAFEKNTQKLLQKYNKAAKTVILLGPLRVDTCTAIPFFLRIYYHFRGKKYLHIFENESKKYKNVFHFSSYYIKSIEEYGNIEGSDRFHPSDEGYRMYSDYILNLLNQNTNLLSVKE